MPAPDQPGRLAVYRLERTFNHCHTGNSLPDWPLTPDTECAR